MNNKDDFESIIPTALYTAYPLIYTDIPFSKEMYNLLSKNGFPKELQNDNLAISLEARYKLIDKLLNQTGITQIIELACGFTTRGLTKCLNNRDIVYVEFDLPKVIKDKKSMLKTFSKIPNNLHFVSGNALDEKDLNKCLKYFDFNKPIAIINQGLMRYLNFEEKEILEKNIHNIISKNDGAWITCDITPLRTNVPNIKDNIILNSVTDRNQTAWRYKDKNHVEQVLNKIGLNIEWHDFTEVIDELVSPEKLNFSKEDTKKKIEGIFVGVMKSKKSLNEVI